MARTPTTTGGNAGDKSDEVFMREVDDAVRRSDLEAFGRRWGLWILALIVLGLAAFGGYIIWHNSRSAADGRTAEQYVTAMDAAQAGDAKTARPILAKLADGSNEGYKAASLILEGNLAGQRKDDKAAVAAYQKVIDDGSVPQPFRDLALIRRTALEFDTIEPAQVVARLKPLAVEGNPWFGPAGEMVGMAYVKMGQEKLAGTLFGAMAKDKALPESTRSRTRQLAGVYGVDAVQDDDSAAGAAPAQTTPAKGEGAN